jgi:hypothetical protein
MARAAGVVIPIDVARRGRRGLCVPAADNGSATVIELPTGPKRSARRRRIGKPQPPRNGHAA